MASSTLHLNLPAEPESVSRARRAVVGLAHSDGLRPEIIGHVAVGVSEAATNVVLHAYRMQARPGRLRVDARLGDRELEVVIGDDGPGVVHRADSPGLGLGMPLMSALASTVEILRDEADRNCLRMRFADRPPAG